MIAPLSQNEVITRDQHPAYVYLGRLAPGSRRGVKKALERAARLISGGMLGADGLDWSSVDYQHVAAVRARLAERLAPATVNLCLSAIRGAVREAWRLGQMTAEAYHRAIDVANVKAHRMLAGRALANEEIEALFSACKADKSIIGKRDAALIAVLVCAGLRRSEAATLEVSDITLSTGELRVHAGKGNKDRITWLPRAALRVVGAWLAARGSAQGPMFTRLGRHGKQSLESISDQAVWQAVDKRRREANVDPFSPHDLRRTWISSLLDAGADISTIQSMAGHASVQTTVRYDRRGDKAKESAANLLAFCG